MNNKIKYFFLVWGISLVFLLPTIPIHEATHYAFDIISPYADPVEFHIFDNYSFEHDSLGYVMSIRNTKLPWWHQPLSESLAYSIQIMVIVMISIYIADKVFPKIKKWPL